MEDMEAGRRISGRKRKISASQGVIIGVATVAGLGLMTKLLSFLRREKPKKIEDGDIQALEAVLSGDAAKSTLPVLTKEVHVFANLENDEPSYEETNGHEVFSKDAEPESLKKDDVTEDRDTNATEAVSHEEVTWKEVPYSNGEEVEVEGKHGKEDAVEHQVEVEETKVNGEAVVTEAHVEEKEKPHIEDAESLPSADVVELPIGDEVKPHIEDALEAHADDEAKQFNGDALEALVEDAKMLEARELPIKSENVAALKNEDEAKPQPEASVEQLIENGEKLEGEGEQAIADAVELIPTKDEEKLQHGEKLETKDEGKQATEEVVELIPTKDKKLNSEEAAKFEL